jgi:type IV secretion system protein VirB10
MGGAAIAATIMTGALLFGLSPQRPRPQSADDVQATMSGPPETIARAPAGYESGNFGPAMADDLAPPDDPLWANPPPPAGGVDRPASPGVDGAPAPGPAAPDPETNARTAPIVFARSHAPSAMDRDVQEARLDARLIAPRSRYEIHAGAVIPAALITGLNSDLPGQVIAQVTAPVYDSVSGAHLLIPQGARLIGAYEGGARYGDRRILLLWNRLILPNGHSLNLGEMSAADPTGASGLQDSVDNHLGRLATAIGLSAIISVVANEAEDEGHETSASLSQSVGDAAAQQAAQTGSEIVRRDLQVRPTLRVRPGARVRVLVTRDIELSPYAS